MLYSLIGIVMLLITVMIWLIILQAILSWLVAFNVINTQNDGVRTFLYWLDRITDPLYRPVRAVLPDFGGIDFSPIVVILALNLINRLLMSLQVQTLTT